MFVLEMEFSVAEIMDVVLSGNPAFSWKGLPNKKELGNFYKTFSVVPNNIGPTEKLFFRRYTFGKTARDDIKGPVHQATHFHIPLFNCESIVAGEYVTGFPLEVASGSQRGLVNFGQFTGLQNGDVGPFVVLSESPVFTSDSSQNEDIYRVEAAPISFPTSVPKDVMQLIKTGHQLVWMPAYSKFYPFKIHFLYNSKLYFSKTIGNNNIRYRALYYAEPMLPIKDGDTYSGKGLVLGFGVSSDLGKNARGLGVISTFDPESVSFEPSA
ncbi:MAG: hypothetical protein Q7T66_04840 [Herminiimonas sp.]|uniref:hypothetical protein n=1 Tax=Herminiimonas sp. TaxID=1926289 RepID=UPI002719BC05|nr:hypothetical protein [Herminiimonas sp.]MDO9419972.1 hypothetical protein [Herminiimonas sp.]